MGDLRSGNIKTDHNKYVLKIRVILGLFNHALNFIYCRTVIYRLCSRPYGPSTVVLKTTVAELCLRFGIDVLTGCIILLENG
jgi:hypothetical protein